jgi:hypothetical protein
MSWIVRSSTDSRRQVLEIQVWGRNANKSQVAGKKQRDVAAADAEMKARRAAQEGKGQEDDGKTASTDLLAAEEDEDVIF